MRIFRLQQIIDRFNFMLSILIPSQNVMFVIQDRFICPAWSSVPFHFKICLFDNFFPGCACVLLGDVNFV